MPMTKREQLLRTKDEYRASHDNAPATARDMAEWAVEAGMYKLPPFAATKKCAEELADAMRLQYMPVKGGRRVRAMHSWPTEQGTLWDDLRTIKRGPMELSTALKRSGVVGEVKQLKRDLDFFNEFHPDEPPIEISFNFENDLADAGLFNLSSSGLMPPAAPPPPSPRGRAWKPAPYRP